MRNEGTLVIELHVAIPITPEDLGVPTLTGLVLDEDGPDAAIDPFVARIVAALPAGTVAIPRLATLG